MFIIISDINGVNELAQIAVRLEGTAWDQMGLGSNPGGGGFSLWVFSAMPLLLGFNPLELRGRTT